MRFKDRNNLEVESRAGSGYWYLGDGVGMCRVLAKHKLYVPTRDISLAPHLIAEGYWESWVSFLVSRIVERGQNVVDVGANVGYYTVLLAEAVGAQGKVASIEANQELANLTWRSAVINGMSNVTVWHRAAWGESGQVLEVVIPATNHVVLDLTPGGSQYLGSGFVTEVVTPPGVVPGSLERPLKKSEVVTTTVDDLLDDMKDRIDFVKIDVEGAEPQVLAGMARTIRLNPKIKILLEHSENHDPKFFEALQSKFMVTKVMPNGSVAPCDERPRTLEMLLVTPR